MANNNIGRLAADMKREIIDIIGHLKDPRIKGFLTVMRIDVTADLDNAKVHISVLGSDADADGAIDALNHASGHVRSEIAKRMHIRKSPSFKFVRDDSAAYAAKINKMLEEL